MNNSESCFGDSRSSISAPLCKNSVRKLIDKESKNMCSQRLINETRVDRAKNELLDEGQVTGLSQLFNALADNSRLQILHALEGGEMCVCDLAALLPCTESAVSHQLRKLRDICLVRARRQGQIIYYRLNDEHVSQLIQIGIEHLRGQE